MLHEILEIRIRFPAEVIFFIHGNIKMLMEKRQKIFQNLYV